LKVYRGVEPAGDADAVSDTAPTNGGRTDDTQAFAHAHECFYHWVAYAQNAAHAVQQHDRHDPQASGLQATVAIDNDTVQVVRIHLNPHEKVPTHDVTPRVVVWLTHAHLRATLADGGTREERATPGQVDWVPAQRHAAENLDDHPVEFVAVIPKVAHDGQRRDQ
jgi:quercetin dioxygenase-like cupin family protein